VRCLLLVLISFFDVCSYRSQLDSDIPNAAIPGWESEEQSLFREVVSSGTALPDTPDADAGVGLSDPQYARQRRRMLDAVNRLRATG
jgi:hypothetical protein